MKKIQISFGIFPADIGGGPSRFARFENEPQPQDVQLIDQAATTVKADLPTWRLRTDYRSELLPNEEEENPEKKVCPTGGCPPDTKLNKDIYEDQLKKEAKKSNLDLDNPTQRRQAHFNILPLFRQQIRENKKYEKSDKEGPPDSLGPEFVIKDGGIYYPAFGKSLQQMYEDQKRLRPKDYDPQEHATMTLMETAFAQGATRVSHVGHNRDENGNEAIRDKITMVFDRETGKGRMEIRNIAREEGHFLSTQEAYEIMKKTHDGFVEGHPLERIFVLTDAPVDTKQVHEILSTVEDEQSSFDEYQSEITQSPQYTMTEFSEWMNPSLIDTRDTQKTFEVPVFLQKLLGFSPVHEDAVQIDLSSEDILVNLLTKNDKVHALQALTIEPKKDAYKDKNLVSVWKQTVQEILGVTESQADRLVKAIEIISKEINNKRETLSLISETGVGTGAAIAIIDSIVLLQLVKPTKLKTDSAKILDIQEHPHKLDKFSQVEETPDIHEEDTVLVWLVSFIDCMKDKPPEEVMGEIYKEEEKTLGNATELWLLFLSLGQEKKTEAWSEPKTGEPIPLEEKEMVEQFQLAVVLWFLLKLTSYFEGLQAFKNTVVNRAVPKEQMKERIPEALIQPEATLWILLAIIWTLAMKREGGVVQRTQTTNTQQSIAVRLQRTAVIYAFAS